MPSKLRRVLPHGVMLAVSCWLYWAATRIDVETGGRIGPAVWPRAVIVLLGLLCVYEIVKRLVVRKEFQAGGLLADVKVEVTAAPDNHRMLYVPEGFAHGFQTLADDTEVSYHMSEFFAPECARGVRWNDPAFGIPWPMAHPILNERDQNYPDFRS